MTENNTEVTLVKQFLRESLADKQLSRAERRTLRSVIANQPKDADWLEQVRVAAFSIAQEAVDSTETSRILEWLSEVTRLLKPNDMEEQNARPARAYFSPGDECPRVIANEIARARESMDICVFTITDNRIRDALLSAHERALPIRIIADNDKVFDQGSDIDELAAAGIQVKMDRTDSHMHHKYAIFDQNVLLTGSYNWTRGAAEMNEENFLITSDPMLLAQFQENFEVLWKKY